MNDVGTQRTQRVREFSEHIRPALGQALVMLVGATLLPIIALAVFAFSEASDDGFRLFTWRDLALPMLAWCWGCTAPSAIVVAAFRLGRGDRGSGIQLRTVFLAGVLHSFALGVGLAGGVPAACVVGVLFLALMPARKTGERENG